MARSDVNHFNLLNRWPVIMEENQWHFNQVAGTGAPLTAQCDAVSINHERDMIANALNLAVEMVAEQLGFYPRPTWIVERATLGANWYLSLQNLKTRYGYIQEFGIRTTSLIDDAVAVTYSDANSDGVDDTATITVTVAAGTSAAEIVPFFRVADGAESAGHINWEIEPVTVSVSSTTATITAPRWLFVKPSRIWAKPYEEPNFTIKFHGDTQQPADFVTLVDIYRVYSDASTAVQVTGDPIYSQCTDLDTAITSDGEAYIVDSRLGRFRSRLTCSDCFNSYPESVYIGYKAGYPLENGKMNRRLETAIIRLANTLMPYQPSTFCDKTLGMWQFDRNNVDPATLTQADLHPFGGLMVGRIEAWRNLRGMALGKGGKITVP